MCTRPNIVLFTLAGGLALGHLAEPPRDLHGGVAPAQRDRQGDGGARRQADQRGDDGQQQRRVLELS